jgi:hypothetical protein
VKKSFYWVLLICLLAGFLWVWATDKNSALTRKMLKPVIEQSCKNELNNSKVWQAAALFMSFDQQTAVQKQICGCVGEHALQNISAKELAMASIDESAKNSLIQQAVMNSVKGCVQDALK